jgi:putative ABC transport system ATP-binding protein
MLELRGICRNFQVGGQMVHALDHVDLDVSAGEYVSIMGPSGSGKSTLLNILGLLDRPSAGRYSLNGEDVSTLDDDALASHRQSNIGFIFQAFHLIPRMSALENVELPLLLSGSDPRTRRMRAREVLVSVGLTDRVDHRPDQLSGGERQRVAIARAVLMQPRLLLADEPTGNLDSRSGTDVIEVLERLNNQGIVLIVVTHDPDVGGRARRHIKMRDGRISSDSSAP